MLYKALNALPINNDATRLNAELRRNLRLGVEPYVEEE